MKKWYDFTGQRHYDKHILKKYNGYFGFVGIDANGNLVPIAWVPRLAISKYKNSKLGFTANKILVPSFDVVNALNPFFRSELGLNSIIIYNNVANFENLQSLIKVISKSMNAGYNYEDGFGFPLNSVISPVS